MEIISGAEADTLGHIGNTEVNQHLTTKIKKCFETDKK
jgi:hypothetical protein